MDITPAEIEQRIERAKLDAMKELAYGASHEINNPLANISARAQSLLRDEADPERRRALRAIFEQAMRAHEMISDLMLFARPPELQLDEVDLAELIARLVDEQHEAFSVRDIRIVVESSESTPKIVGDAQNLHIAFSAVVRNAMEAIGRNGTLSIQLRDVEIGQRLHTGELAACHVEIRDDGPGFSEAALRHAFDPFYSGREAGRGLGFGLSKCWRIVTQHGGDVQVENLATGGACVAVLLPQRPPSDLIEPDDRPSVEPSSASPRRI